MGVESEDNEERPTPEDVQRNHVTHIPFRSWCPSSMASQAVPGRGSEIDFDDEGSMSPEDGARPPRSPSSLSQTASATGRAAAGRREMAEQAPRERSVARVTRLPKNGLGAYPVSDLGRMAGNPLRRYGLEEIESLAAPETRVPLRGRQHIAP